MDHLEKWTTNESLLQSYRQIFTGSQAFFLALGTIIINSDTTWLFYAVAALGLFMIWYVWYRVVRVRHLAVDYHKYLHRYLVKHGQEPEGICTEGEYIDIKTRSKRKATNQVLKVKTNLRLTRFKIDILLPIAYTLTWVILAVYKLTA